MANKSTKVVRVSEEELALIKAAREGRLAVEKRGVDQDGADKISATPTPTEAQQALADAFVSAIERTRPPTKKTIANFESRTPWTPPKGTPRSKMRRKFYHHGLIIGDNVTNEEIDLLNKIKPGAYCEGWVKVTLRKDRGLDVDYPVRTNAQRLRLVNQFGIRSFSELLRRVIDERANPVKYRKPEDSDLYDLDE